MKSTLYLCGAGNAEGVRLALRVNKKESCWETVVLLDDDPDKRGMMILGVKIVGPFETLKQADSENSEVANLVAGTTKKRYAALLKIKEYGLPFATLIDPDVDTWGVKYDKDITIYQNVTFAAGAFVGADSVVFSGAAIGHGCRVGEGCVIAPGAVLNARNVLGDGVYVGTNSSTLPDLKIGCWATIGMNSAVVQDIPEGATAIGVPAGILNQRVSPKPKAIYKAPESEFEKTIADIWATVFKVEKIGVEDNFFDLGGSSLAAIQISFQIQKRLKVEIPLKEFFDNPTISGLSKKVEAGLIESTNVANLEKLLDEIEGVSKRYA